MELTRMRRLAVCTLVVGALAPAGAGAALACHGGQHHNNGVKAASFTMRHHFGHQDGALAVASSYLGVSKDTIKADLKSGQTLGQIADATAGRSSAGLVAAFGAALQAKLDVWVSKGKLTSAQEADIVAKAVPWFQKLVTTSFTQQFAHHH